MHAPPAGRQQVLNPQLRPGQQLAPWSLHGARNGLQHRPSEPHVSEQHCEPPSQETGPVSQHRVGLPVGRPQTVPSQQPPPPTMESMHGSARLRQAVQTEDAHTSVPQQLRLKPHPPSVPTQQLPASQVPPQQSEPCWQKSKSGTQEMGLHLPVSHE